MTLTPAYGRDYKSKKEVIAAWEAGKDFIVADMFGGNCGRCVNKDDAASVRETIYIRYKNLTQIMKLPAKKASE